MLDWQDVGILREVEAVITRVFVMREDSSVSADSSDQLVRGG